MKKIGRPRKSERKENISVNLPKHVVDRINDQLSWKSSRSEWIEGAIKNKLGASDYLENVDLDEIVLYLHSILVRKDHRRTIKSLYIDGVSDESRKLWKLQQDNQI